MKKYVRQFKEEESEEAKSTKAIKDLIELKAVTEESDQGAMLAILKGLVFGDNKVADKFLTAFNDWTSSLKIEDFE